MQAIDISKNSLSHTFNGVHFDNGPLLLNRDGLDAGFKDTKYRESNYE